MPAKRDNRIKKANIKTEMSPAQVQEFKRCAQDPIYFICNYVYIQHPTKGQIKFKMYKYQKKLVRAFQKNRFNIVKMSRQSGKSITSSAFLLWYSIFKFDKNVLIVSNKNSSAMEMIRRIKYAYELLPMFLKPGVSDDEWTKHAIGFDNRSRIVSSATSEDAGRSAAVSLLFCDELAFVKPNIQKDFWQSILPTLSTGGSAIVASTPNGSSDLFAELWRRAALGDDNTNEDDDALGFVPTEIKWDEVPGRGEKFKRQTIALTSELAWKQEYECQFLSSEALLVDSMVLETLKLSLRDPKTIIHGVKFWQDIEEGKTYILGVDPATGTGSDFSVIQVFSLDEMEQICEMRSNTTSSPDLYVLMKGLITFIEKRGGVVLYSIENNGVGEGMVSLVQVDETPPDAELISEEGKDRLGMTTTTKTKMRGCLAIKNMIEKQAMVINSSVLHAELCAFVRHAGSYSAQYGSTDDAIAAVLVCIRVIEEIAEYEEAAHNKLYKIDAGDIDAWGCGDAGEDGGALPIVF